MADTSAKDLVAVVRKSPALMITLGVVFVALLVYLYEKGQGSSASTTAATAAVAATTPAGTGSYTFEENIQQQPTPSIVVPPANVGVSPPLPGAPSNAPAPLIPMPAPTPPVNTLQQPSTPFPVQTAYTSAMGKLGQPTSSAQAALQSSYMSYQLQQTLAAQGFTNPTPQQVSAVAGNLQLASTDPNPGGAAYYKALAAGQSPQQAVIASGVAIGLTPAQAQAAYNASMALKK